MEEIDSNHHVVLVKEMHLEVVVQVLIEPQFEVDEQIHLDASNVHKAVASADGSIPSWKVAPETST